MNSKHIKAGGLLSTHGINNFFWNLLEIVQKEPKKYLEAQELQLIDDKWISTLGEHYPLRHNVFWWNDFLIVAQK